MVALESATTEQLKEAIVYRAKEEKALKRQAEAEQFREHGVEEFKNSISGIEDLHTVAGKAGAFASKVYKLFPTGNSRGRKPK